MAGEERTFQIKSKSVLIKTVQAIPEKFYESSCKLKAQLTNNSVPIKKKIVVDNFLQIGKPQREMCFEAEGSEIGVAKQAIIYLLRRGYRGDISFQACFRWCTDYPGFIEYYEFANLDIEGNILTLSCDKHFPVRLKNAFKNILTLYPSNK